MNTDGCELNDVYVKAHLDIRDQRDVVEYKWVNTKIMDTSLVFRTEVVINVTSVLVGDPLE